MIPLSIYHPAQLDSNDPPALERFRWRFLAEGDSWFTIGTLNPAKNSNLLFEMAFEASACAVTCAFPGDTLLRMSQMNSDKVFAGLLAGRTARPWDAILLSAGGNDLIDAVQTPTVGVAPDKRLLLRADEWGDPAIGAARYLSDAGWATFCDYLKANLDHLVALRDRGRSQGVPIFMHGYAVPTPRPAGIGMGIGPWLFPAVSAAGVPQAELIGVAKLLLGRLAALLAGCAADAARFPNLHFFDSTALDVVPAELGTSGESGDWVNEIHLTWRGYEKVALPWCASIEAVMKAR